jgi:hypothetical protein
MKISDIPTNTLAAELSNDRIGELKTAIFEALHGDRKKISGIYHQCDLEELRRGLRPPTPRKPARSEEEQERECISGFRRIIEMRLLRRCVLVNQHHRPSRPADAEVFDAAVDHALGSSDATFPRMAADAARKPDARFFDTAAKAIRAVADAKTSKIRIEKAHVAAVLQAKLQLEQTTGRLPTKKAVRELAIKIFPVWFGASGLTAYAENKKGPAMWKIIFRKAKLDYLPGDVRGPAKEKKG